jgi:glycosyltransferase involved in cell wall biosynthesis
MPERIVQIGAEWLPNRAGGMNRYFYGLVHAVARAGLNASAIVTYLRDGQQGPIRLMPMAREGAGVLERMRGARRRMREACAQGAELVNTHFALYAYPCMQEIPPQARLIVSFHGPWADEMLAEHDGLRWRMQAALARAIERRVYRRADRLITLSHSFAAIADERYGVAPDRIHVVPGGLDLGAYVRIPLDAKREARRRLGWPDDRPIVLTVRRLARRMGLERLVDAACLLAPEFPRLLVLIAGKGPLEAELRSRIAARGVDNNVRLIGFVPDEELPLAYAAADLTVVPSVALEGFGLVSVESMAAGTPVIGTPIGGTTEVLSGISTALLTASAETEAIAAKLREALSGKLAMPAPAECRRYALRFDWEAVWPNIERVWQEADRR